MKLTHIIVAGIFSLALLTACKENTNKNGENNTEKSEKAVALKKIEVKIEGMTCAIGCAKTIESKLSKTAGIESATVNFEEKLGEITFDSNQISKEEITKQITAVAGGELYSVSDVKEIN